MVVGSSVVSMAGLEGSRKKKVIIQGIFGNNEIRAFVLL